MHTEVGRQVAYGQATEMGMRYGIGYHWSSGQGGYFMYAELLDDAVDAMNAIGSVWHVVVVDRETGIIVAERKTEDDGEDD